MIKALSSFSICIILSANCLAQIVNINGKVTDQQTGAVIPGASVRVDQSATSTSASGEFNMVLNKESVMKSGITITCIGYQKQHLNYREGAVYHVKMQQATMLLKEVVIGADAETILQKAIRRIPLNYPDKDFMMEGLLRMNEISKDSVKTYRYYRNDAAIRMFYPSYLKPGDAPQVSIIENKYKHLQDPSRSKDSVKVVAGYNLVPGHDVVHYRADFISKDGIKKFSYVNQGKSIINGFRVYVINFFSKTSEQIAGTMYIDTTSYAFVRFDITRHNIKRLFFVTIDKGNTLVNYKKVDGKWYLDDVKLNFIARHNGLELNHTLDYKTALIDTVNIHPMSYQEKIQVLTEDIKVNKKDAEPAWMKHITPADSAITMAPVPVVDTVWGKGKRHTDILGPVVNYIRNDNIRFSLGVAHLPFTFNGYQPLLSKNISNSAAYSIDFNTQYRLFKELFLNLGTEKNYGIGGIKIQSDNYLLSYNFEFNSNHRPITISPSFGYNRIEFKDHNFSYYRQKNMVYGVDLAYEITHRKSFFISTRYLDPTDTYNAGLNLSTQRLYFSAGILFKLK